MVEIFDFSQTGNHDQRQTPIDFAAVDFLAQSELDRIRPFHMTPEELEKAELLGFSAPPEEVLYGRKAFLIGNVLNGKVVTLDDRLVDVVVTSVANQHDQPETREEERFNDGLQYLADTALGKLIDRTSSLRGLNTMLNNGLIGASLAEKKLGRKKRAARLARTATQVGDLLVEMHNAPPAEVVSIQAAEATQVSQAA